MLDCKARICCLQTWHSVNLLYYLNKDHDEMRAREGQWSPEFLTSKAWRSMIPCNLNEQELYVALKYSSILDLYLRHGVTYEASPILHTLVEDYESQSISDQSQIFSELGEIENSTADYLVFYTRK
ncbi:unnamed protein product [Ilex paraguariensis]|uniref:Uncharacterized protein n=1 Tax=Ilex paraguariensis TaxID=185542 RepID=A0ABC8SMQ9_9AQUA